MPACSSCGGTVAKTAKFCGQCGTPNNPEAEAPVEAPKKDVVLVDIPNQVIALATWLELLGLGLMFTIIRKGASLSLLEKWNVNLLKGKLDNNILWWVGFGLAVALCLGAVAALVQAMNKSPKIETQV